ncbi:helix-turn-helix domain-containing protein [Xanthobacter aminoxidans]|uniref:helix-turn-helix transcriptional regulator n=1 Tax=Xanthobacter aminoxidans TaxID=186280 RepID=UPI00372A4E05
MEQTTKNNLMSDREAAAFLKMSPVTLNTWRCRGRGPKYVKLGGRVFYRPDDLEAFIRSSVVDPTATAC